MKPPALLCKHQLMTTPLTASLQTSSLSYTHTQQFWFPSVHLSTYKIMHDNRKMFDLHIPTVCWPTFSVCSCLLFTSIDDVIRKLSLSVYTLDCGFVSPGAFLRLFLLGLRWILSAALTQLVHICTLVSSTHTHICHPETLPDSSNKVIHHSMTHTIPATEKQQPACSPVLVFPPL